MCDSPPPRTDRHAVGPPRAVAGRVGAPAAEDRPAEPRPPGDPQRHPLEAAHRRALAGCPRAVRPLVHRVPPVLALATGGPLGPPVGASAGPAGAAAAAASATP